MRLPLGGWQSQITILPKPWKITGQYLREIYTQKKKKLNKILDSQSQQQSKRIRKHDLLGCVTGGIEDPRQANQ